MAVTCLSPLPTVEAPVDWSLSVISVVGSSSMCRKGSYGKLSRVPLLTEVFSNLYCLWALNVSVDGLLTRGIFISMELPLLLALLWGFCIDWNLAIDLDITYKWAPVELGLILKADLTISESCEVFYRWKTRLFFHRSWKQNRIDTVHERLCTKFLKRFISSWIVIVSFIFR